MSNQQIISKTDGLPVRSSGFWIKRKHYFLRSYCQIFTAGMRKKWKKLTFVDLFAGPGRCVIRDTLEELEGSPLIALPYDFTDYVFVEEDQESLDALKLRCAKSPKKKQISFLKGDCNDMINKVIAKIDPQSLAFAFIDPTKINIDFDTVRKLAEDRRIDLLINIPDGMDIKRNFNIYKRQGDSSYLGRFLGGSVPWKDLRKPLDAVELYKKRVRELGYETVRFKDIEVRNTKNAPMYFLFFASKNSMGLKYWNEITKRDEQGQGELF